MDDLPDIRFINTHPKHHGGHHTTAEKKKKKHEVPTVLVTVNIQPDQLKGNYKIS